MNSPLRPVKAVKSAPKAAAKKQAPSSQSFASKMPVSKWTKLLLWALRISVVWMGWLIFMDLNSLTEEPPMASCFYEGAQICSQEALTEEEKTLGIATLAEEIREPYRKLENLRVTQREEEALLAQKELELAEMQNAFNESGASEEPSELVRAREAYVQAQSSDQILKQEITRLEQSLQPEFEKWDSLQEKAQKSYENKAVLIHSMRFGLQIGFILPLLLLSLHFLKRKSKIQAASTSLFEALTQSFGLLAFLSFLSWIILIFPEQLFQQILEFFQQSPALLYFLYYGSLAFVTFVFGGLAVLVQKRIFSPEKIAYRRLKKSTCPSCEFPIHREDNFCPSCQMELMIPCKHCGEFKSRFLPFCSSCGKA